MVLSKSFGYALRGILYITLTSDEKRKISIDEMAGKLAIPKFFLAKIMKQVVKSGVVSATRGQHGGFYLNDRTLKYTLADLILMIEGQGYFNTCMLNMGKCDAAKPCPMHNLVTEQKEMVLSVYKNTTIGDLMKGDKETMLNSIDAHLRVPVLETVTD